MEPDAEPARSPFVERAGTMFMHAAELMNIGAYRLSGGTFGSNIGEAPVLLLAVSGRRSGTRRTKPLLALPDDEGGWIVVASRAGATADPEWFKNLMAYERDPLGATLEPPTVEVEGRPAVAVRASVLEGEERARWWTRLNAVYPKFDRYQGRTDRVIPVVRLSPAHPTTPR